MIRLRLFGHYEFGAAQGRLVAGRILWLTARWRRRPEAQSTAENPDLLEIPPPAEKRKAA